eukprot:TRINITY_DN14588_c0_g2_i1.p1 TRINITY_DN14588_c0_g2~~TRINITY_DN14588_c0_g2_i1.p1  ORF type:complete len:410 (+),score=127.85 TRINITY_DN14588_c0_g2_i1:54-1283(+)
MSGCPFGYGAKPEGEDTKKFSILGFETEITGDGEMTNLKRDRSLCNYTDYIQTEALLKLQEGESIMKPDRTGMMHHEELLFIITHQSIELWFKVLLKDLEKAKEMLVKVVDKEATSPVGGQVAWKDLALVGHYLRRSTMIFHHASGTFPVLQTMHPADFLEFRDFLVPASGFQSFQFRQIEILLGVNEKERASCNGSHVFNALQEEQKEECEKQIEANGSIKKVLEDILMSVKVPDTFMEKFYECTEELQVLRQKGPAHHTDERAKAMGKEKMEEIKELIENPIPEMKSDDARQRKESACLKAALYVSSYRNELPQFAVMSEVLDELVALEEGLLLFRSRHLHNVERVIGRRAGTGGSSGVGYLERTREYRVFTTLWTLRQVFVRSSILPPLSSFHSDPSNVDLFKKDA